jgi:hypothetical protein
VGQEGLSKCSVVRSAPRFHIETTVFSWDRYYAEKARYEQTISEAKKAVGLTSNMAEEETRNLFWDMFSRGQGFAKVWRPLKLPCVRVNIDLTRRSSPH